MSRVAIAIVCLFLAIATVLCGLMAGAYIAERFG